MRRFALHSRPLARRGDQLKRNSSSHSGGGWCLVPADRDKLPIPFCGEFEYPGSFRSALASDKLAIFCISARELLSKQRVVLYRRGKRARYSSCNENKNLLIPTKSFSRLLCSRLPYIPVTLLCRELLFIYSLSAVELDFLALIASEGRRGEAGQSNIFARFLLLLKR